ncbi:hypothetical protein Tco_0009562 [Tanacetum coccineum]
MESPTSNNGGNKLTVEYSDSSTESTLKKEKNYRQNMSTMMNHQSAEYTKTSHCALSSCDQNSIATTTSSKTSITGKKNTKQAYTHSEEEDYNT